MTLDGWPELVPFEDDPRGELPAFPIDILPERLADYAKSIAAHYLAPVDLPAVLMLGTVSASIAGRVRLRIGADWIEPANVYLLAVLSPSLHKSPILKLATAPIEREEQDLVERWRVVERDKAATREVVKHHIRLIKRGKAKTDTDESLRLRLAELQELAPAPRPQLMIDDSTSEHIVHALAGGPLFVSSAEGRAFELMSGLYRKQGEDGADVYLKAWSEDPIRSGRVTSGTVYVPHPNLTMCLAVQPIVVDKLSRREDFRGRGLIARFLCSFPRTRAGFRQWKQAQAIDPVARFNYDHLVSRLLALPRPPPGQPAPAVNIAGDADADFFAYRQELEDAQRQGRLLAEWQDLGGKLAGHCARLALVLHMAEHGEAGTGMEVSRATIGSAIILARYFAAHTIATWDGCAVEPPAARVLRWVARERREVVTTRQIHRAHQKLCQRAQDARSHAVELAERGYLRPAGEPDVWDVSPRLYVNPSARRDTRDGAPQRRTDRRKSNGSAVTVAGLTADDVGDSAPDPGRGHACPPPSPGDPVT